MTCPCCSDLLYDECCKPYHEYKKIPSTAEALMRSRYCAYAIPNGEYLMHTTYISQRHLHNQNDMQQWGEENTWIRLEIIATPEKNKVEFKAYYIDKKGKKQVHYELSTFKKQDGRWYYFSSKFLQV